MTANAVFLQNPAILGFDHDWLMEILEGKAFGVVVPVVRFGQVLRNKGVWQMTVHTGGHAMMARFLPRVELWSHDMTIHAGSSVEVLTSK